MTLEGRKTRRVTDAVQRLLLCMTWLRQNQQQLRGLLDGGIGDFGAEGAVAAATVDGDGSLGVNETSRRTAFVEINQSKTSSTPDSLIYLQRQYGGNITRKDREEPQRPIHLLHSPQTSSSCQFLLDIFSFGVLKNNQAGVILIWLLTNGTDPSPYRIILVTSPTAISLGLDRFNTPHDSSSRWHCDCRGVWGYVSNKWDDKTTSCAGTGPAIPSSIAEKI